MKSREMDESLVKMLCNFRLTEVKKIPRVLESVLEHYQKSQALSVARVIFHSQ